MDKVLGNFVKIENDTRTYLAYGKKPNGKRVVNVFSVDGFFPTDNGEWKEVYDEQLTEADFPAGKSKIAVGSYWHKESVPHHLAKIVAISDGCDYMKNVFYQYPDGSGGHEKFWQWNGKFFEQPKQF